MWIVDRYYHFARAPGLSEFEFTATSRAESNAWLPMFRFIFFSTTSEKFKIAQLNNIPSLRQSWLTDSVEAGHAIFELNEYHMHPDVAVSTPKKPEEPIRVVNTIYI